MYDSLAGSGPVFARRSGARLARGTFAALAAALALPAAVRAQQQPVRPACTTPVVNAPAGAICGTTDTTVVAGQNVVVPVYRGISYAQAPTGAAGLRWKAPQPLGAPDSTMRATAFGLFCPQSLVADTTSLSPLVVVNTLPATQSEDCLYLNVWTPPGATSGSNLPVMVFIHGGAFIEGWGSAPTYNGAYLAAADTVVLVTLNYRLGALGFLYSGANGVAGNFGLLDQQAALQWVRRNINAFGGDSSQVTVFGESAGAMSVGFHLFDMPSSDSLFRAAIMESNPFGVVYRDTTAAQLDGNSYIDSLCTIAGGAGCGGGAASWFNTHAQEVSTAQVLQAQAAFESILLDLLRLTRGRLSEGLPWTPVVDGQLVMGQPLLGYVSGMTRKPYMFGFNRDEGVLFAGFVEDKLTVTKYRELVLDLWPVSASTITLYTTPGNQSPYNALNAAPVAGMPTPASALSNLITDLIFKCANLVAADSGYSANQAAPTAPPVFGYLFERSPVPFMPFKNIEACSASTGAVCHSDELPYVFNTILTIADPAISGNVAPTAQDTSLARQMAAAWGNFAKRPMQPPVVGWEPYATNGGVYSWSGSTNGPMVEDVATQANCTQLWYTLYPLRGGSVSTTAAGPSSTAPPGGLLQSGR
jgi:carboxylesterase type B